MAKISVIVPVYNVEAYIDGCIKSILSQTFEKFELILVDDGSPDKCGEICDQYARTDSRIIVIHQENGGLSKARNTGIDWVLKNNRSEWITFIDSDDRVHHRMLEFMYEAITENNTDIVVGDYQKVYSFDNLVESEQYHKTIYNASDFFAENTQKATVAVCKLYHKNLFKDCRFPNGKLHEDVFTTYKLFAKADKIVYLDCVLYFYYQNESSIVHSQYSLRKLDEVEAGEEQVAFFKERHDEKNLIQAYRRLMYYYDSHIRNLKTLPEGKPYYKKLRRKLSKLLRKKAKICDISIEKNSAYYESAFPIFMKFYWKWKKVQSLLHKSL